MLNRFRRVLAPDAPGTQGGAADPQFIDNLAGQVARLISKNNGDPTEALNLVLAENQRYRDRHRQDQAIIQQFRDAQPDKDARVIKGDEVKLFDAAKALNLKPEELTALPAKLTDLQIKQQAYDFRDLATKAAEAEDLEPNVLAELLQQRNIHLELKELTVPDPKDATKTTKKIVPHVRPKADDKAALEPLATYVDRELKLYGPALRKDARNGNSLSPRADGRRTNGTMASFPTQSASSDRSKATGNAAENVDRHLSSQYALPGAAGSSSDKKE